MTEQKFPPGWDEKRVKDLIGHYENQTEDEEFTEIEESLDAEDITLMAIPSELVPEVRALLAPSKSPDRQATIVRYSQAASERRREGTGPQPLSPPGPGPLSVSARSGLPTRLLALPLSLTPVVSGKAPRCQALSPMACAKLPRLLASSASTSTGKIEECHHRRIAHGRVVTGEAKGAGLAVHPEDGNMVGALVAAEEPLSRGIDRRSCADSLRGTIPRRRSSTFPPVRWRRSRCRRVAGCRRRGSGHRLRPESRNRSWCPWKPGGSDEIDSRGSAGLSLPS